MYEVTQDYLDKATAAGRVYSLRVDVGEVVDGFYEDKAQYFGGVGVLSLKIVRGQTTGGFTLGGTVCAQLSATFTNDVDVRVKDRLQIYVRFGSGSKATAWKSLGWFYVDAVKQGLYNKSVTAYDAMLRFEKNYKSKLTYPASTSNVLNEISEQMKIGLSSNVSLVNDAVIDEKPQRGKNKNNEQLYYTRREMLGYIGAVNGGKMYIDVDFTINLAVPTETNYTIAAANVISQSVDDTNFTIDGIVWNKSGVSYSLNDEFTENTVELVNPLNYSGVESILHNLETKLIGLTYSSVTLKKQGTGVFQLGDLVNYAAPDGTVYTLLIMGITYDFSNGFFSETLYSLAKSASQQEYTGSQVVNASESTSSQINVNNLTQYEVLSDTSIKYNGITYTAELADSGLISKISDNKGGEFSPTFADGVTNITLHNAAFLAVAMISGLKRATSGWVLTNLIHQNTEVVTKPKSFNTGIAGMLDQYTIEICMQFDGLGNSSSNQSSTLFHTGGLSGDWTALKIASCDYHPEALDYQIFGYWHFDVVGDYTTFPSYKGELSTITLVVRKIDEHGSEVKVYSNGELRSTKGEGWYYVSLSNYMLLNAKDIDRTALGTVYQVRIYDRVLTDAEVAQNASEDRRCYG